MKGTFVKISVFAITFGVVLASCNNEAENVKLQEVDDLAIQELVDAKLASLDSAVQAEWNAKVLVAADSVLAEEAKKKGATHHMAAKPKPVAKKEEPKPATNTVNSRVGSDQSQTKINTINSRSGSDQTQEKKNTISSRSGATKQ